MVLSGVWRQEVVDGGRSGRVETGRKETSEQTTASQRLPRKQAALGGVWPVKHQSRGTGSAHRGRQEFLLPPQQHPEHARKSSECSHCFVLLSKAQRDGAGPGHPLMETPSHTSAFCGEKEPLVGWGGPVVAQQRKKGIWEGLGRREGAQKRTSWSLKTSLPEGVPGKNYHHLVHPPTAWKA